MKKFAAQPQQEQVNAYFQSRSAYWTDVYTGSGGSDVDAEIYRERHARVLAWIDSLALPPGSRVLEIGCGAGFMSIALAQRGLRVHAIDAVEAMVEQARRHAAEAGITDRLCLEVGDIYALGFENESFDLVIAIGVIPWLERAELAIQEMARVTRPGGHIILTADNRQRLNNLLDPLRNPTLTPLKQGVKHALERLGLRRRLPDQTEAPFYTYHDCRFIDMALAQAALVKTRGMTLGFGPFSLLRRKVVPEPFATTLYHRLQRLADRGVPGFRSTGVHYLVLASKSASWPLLHSTSTEKSVTYITKIL
ncbi:MAG TPA: methyltransferase domain-containing protein [Ktedonobacteraceae bacterium]|nr:methyltransferase domain-containing protein [Ktedonobacteraceae bacterium]